MTTPTLEPVKPSGELPPVTPITGDSVPPKSSQKDKVWRECPYCTHKWLAKPSAKLCPNNACAKYVGRIKKDKIEKKPDEALGGDILIEKNDNLDSPAPPADTPSFKQNKKREEVKADVPAQTLVGIIALPFDLMAAKTGKSYMKLSEDEKKSLAPVLKKVGDKWIGKWFNSHPDEAALILTMGLIVGAKLAMYMTDPDVVASKKRRSANGNRNPPVPASTTDANPA